MLVGMANRPCGMGPAAHKLGYMHSIYKKCNKIDLLLKCRSFTVKFSSRVTNVCPGFFGSKAQQSEAAAMEQFDPGSKGCGRSKGYQGSDGHRHSPFEGFGKGRAPGNGIAVASATGAVSAGGKGSKGKNSTAEGASNHFTVHPGSMGDFYLLF